MTHKTAARYAHIYIREEKGKLIETERERERDQKCQKNVF